jgi:nitroreductase
METLDAIETRRSIRRFQPDPVPEEDIIMMLRAANSAPSGGNRQPWKFMVVQSQSWKEKMAETIKKSCTTLPTLFEGVVLNPQEFSTTLKKRIYLVSLFFVDAPVVFVACVMRDENNLWKCYLNQGLDRYEAVMKFGLVEILSCSAAVENLLLAAHDLGYGGCWMNIPFMAKDALEDLFDITWPWEILAMIPVGIPAHHPKQPKKKKVEDIAVFIDKEYSNEEKMKTRSSISQKLTINVTVSISYVNVQSAGSIYDF